MTCYCKYPLYIPSLTPPHISHKNTEHFTTLNQKCIEYIILKATQKVFTAVICSYHTSKLRVRIFFDSNFSDTKGGSYEYDLSKCPSDDELNWDKNSEPMN